MSDNEFLDAFESDSTESKPGTIDVGPSSTIGEMAAFAKTAWDIDTAINPVNAAANVVNAEWNEINRMADGRSITDLAAQGEDKILHGDPREVWDQIKPENSPISDDAGEAILGTIQGAGTGFDAITPGGSFNTATNTINEVMGPKPEPHFSGIPPNEKTGAAEGTTDGSDESSTPPLKTDDAVDAVMGGFDAPAPDPAPALPEDVVAPPEDVVAPTSEPPLVLTNPDAAPEPPVIAPNPDLGSGPDVSVPAPDVPDMSASYDSGPSADDGGTWDASSDPSSDDGF